MTKLKECPFCGGEANGDFGDDGLGFIQYFIECSNKCEVCPSVRDNNKHDAAKAWNSRADSSVATEQNKQLVGALEKCIKDSELWFGEYGEPKSGEYSAAFIDAIILLDEHRESDK